jgi:hypothetical protein
MVAEELAMAPSRGIVIAFFWLTIGCSGDPTPGSQAEQSQPTGDAQQNATVVTQNDKVEAVRLILGWLQGKTKLHGFKHDYPDKEWMKADTAGSTLLVCDFLPKEAEMTGYPRFRRIAGAELDALLNKFRQDLYDKINAGTLRIVLREEGKTHFVFEVDNHIHVKVGHRCVFTFRKASMGLQAEGSWPPYCY